MKPPTRQPTTSPPHYLKRVEFLTEAPINAVGGGRLISFKDPEGNVCQIVERPANFPQE